MLNCAGCQGNFSPSGRLPITYPKFNNGVTYYWHKHSHQCNSVSSDSVATDPVLDRFPHWSPGPSTQPGGCQTEWDFGDGLVCQQPFMTACDSIQLLDA